MGESTSADVDPEKQRRASQSSAHAWLARACVIVPAFDAESSIAAVIAGLREAIPELRKAIIVVDDGSRDATASVARKAECLVVASDAPAHHDEGGQPPLNRGKGAALRAGLRAASSRGWTVALTVDADGQHLADEARKVLLATEKETALVLGVRDLVRDGAPRANRFSNGISNYFLSRFAHRPLHDTQCGLRRYPVRETLALAARGDGYDFEAEVLLRAIWSGLEVVEEPVRVLYPESRTTHFRAGRDVRKIIGTVLGAVGDQWLGARRTETT